MCFISQVFFLLHYKKYACGCPLQCFWSVFLAQVFCFVLSGWPLYVVSFVLCLFCPQRFSAVSLTAVVRSLTAVVRCLLPAYCHSISQKN